MIDHVFGKGSTPCLMPFDSDVGLQWWETHGPVLLFVYFEDCFNQLIELNKFKISIQNT